ncbi:hypothetical protein GCM10023187_12370 [Nibrella viscosa]|uniref:Uncharacterized protein n=1 Tax=Nibrella viscosa TaxID=1084524 RepID=A0ABP8K3D9_9BACT
MATSNPVPHRDQKAASQRDILITSTIVKKVAPGKFRYFFSFHNLSDQPLDTVIRIRVYPRFFRLLCPWSAFRLTLAAGRSGYGSVDADHLYKNPRFQWQTPTSRGRGRIAPEREDLTHFSQLAAETATQAPSAAAQTPTN